MQPLLSKFPNSSLSYTVLKKRFLTCTYMENLPQNTSENFHDQKTILNKYSLHIISKKYAENIYENLCGKTGKNASEIAKEVSSHNFFYAFLIHPPLKQGRAYQWHLAVV